MDGPCLLNAAAGANAHSCLWSNLNTKSTLLSNHDKAGMHLCHVLCSVLMPMQTLMCTWSSLAFSRKTRFKLLASRMCGRAACCPPAILCRIAPARYSTQCVEHLHQGTHAVPVSLLAFGHESEDVRHNSMGRVLWSLHRANQVRCTSTRLHTHVDVDGSWQLRFQGYFESQTRCQ